MPSRKDMIALRKRTGQQWREVLLDKVRRPAMQAIVARIVTWDFFGHLTGPECNATLDDLDSLPLPEPMPPLCDVLTALEKVGYPPDVAQKRLITYEGYRVPQKRVITRPRAGGGLLKLAERIAAIR